MVSITVCTPTYNRAFSLDRPFKSLMRQTDKSFEWLIIDDGSVDNTVSIVDEFKTKADFNIRYFYKPNGGRHTALNHSYKYINTPYVINLDSDDELVDDAIEKMKRAWEAIPAQDLHRVWAVSGRCIDSESHQIVGPLYPVDINKFGGKGGQRRQLSKISGEKSCCRRVDILKQYPFPECDVKFITENTIWKKIELTYDYFCTNDVFRVYYQDSPDSLGKGSVHLSTRTKSFYYYYLFCLNDLFGEFFVDKDVRRAVVAVSRCAINANIPYQEVMSQIRKWHKKCLVTLAYPISYVYIFLKQRK